MPTPATPNAWPVHRDRTVHSLPRRRGHHQGLGDCRRHRHPGTLAEGLGGVVPGYHNALIRPTPRRSIRDSCSGLSAGDGPPFGQPLRNIVPRRHPVPRRPPLRSQWRSPWRPRAPGGAALRPRRLTLPSGLRALAENQPLTAVIETLRALLLGTELDNHGCAPLRGAWASSPWRSPSPPCCTDAAPRGDAPGVCAVVVDGVEADRPGSRAQVNSPTS